MGPAYRQLADVSEVDAGRTVQVVAHSGVPLGGQREGADRKLQTVQPGGGHPVHRHQVAPYRLAGPGDDAGHHPGHA